MINKQFEQLLENAIAAMQSNDDQNALALLQQASQQQPSSALPYFLMAGCYAQNGQFDIAEAAYTSALQCQPDLAIARFQLGLLQLTSARPAMAFVTWQPLDELSEEDPLRLFKTGLEYMARDQFEEAKSFLRRGLQTNHDNPPLNRDMQMVIERIEQTQATLPVDSAADEANSSQHVLLSGYHQIH